MNGGVQKRLTSTANVRVIEVSESGVSKKNS